MHFFIHSDMKATDDIDTAIPFGVRPCVCSWHSNW